MKKLVMCALMGMAIGMTAPVNTTIQQDKSLQKSVQEKISYVAKFISQSITNPEEYSSGTCFPIKCVKVKEGIYKIFYLTNNHVVVEGNIFRIENFGEKDVGFSDKKRDMFLKVDVVLRDSPTDMAMVSTFSPYPIPVLELDYSTQKAFKHIFVVGFPLGAWPHLTEGKLGSKLHVAKKIRWAMNAPIIFGNSGGPVIDARTGKIIGIATNILTFGFNGHYYNCSVMVPLSSSWRLIEKALAEN